MKIAELHESFCQYQETIRNYRATTIKSYRETLRTFLQACPEVERIDEVSFLIAQKFFYWGRSTKKWSASTFITHHKRLNVFFKWAKERNFVSENPFEQIEKPRQDKSLPKRLTKQEALADSGLKRLVLRIREASGTYFYIHMPRPIRLRLL